MHTLFRAMPAADPAHYVRGQYDGYRDDRRASPRTRRPRPTRRCAWTSTTGAGRACRSSSAPASTCRSRRPSCAWSSERPPRSGFHAQPRRARPSRASSWSSSTRPPASGCSSRPSAARTTEPEQITLDMEFADEGGEGADAVRGPAARRDARRQHALHPPGQRRGDLAGHAAAARRAAAGPPVREGHRGGPARPTARRRPRRLARTVGGVMTPGRATTGSRGRAAPERRGAVAVPADRRLRVPVGLPHRRARRARRRRSTGCASRASTRRACSGRCSTARRATSGSGRSAINVPASARLRARHEHRSITTWKTPTRLGRRPRRADAWARAAARTRSRRTPGRRPTTTPTTCSCAPCDCIEGRVEIELVCEPVFDYGRDAGGVDARRRRPPRRRRHGRRADDPAADRHGARHRGRPVRARHVLCTAATSSYCALSWAEDLASPADARRGATRGSTQTTRFWRSLARARAAPRPPLARADPALGADDQGPHLHADRRDGRRADDVAARDARRRAQLGLPLHVDARLDVHAAGAALAQPRLGGRRVHAVRRRPRAERRRRAADHVRDRRAPRPDRVDARRPLRLRRRAPGAHRQRRVRPAPERRLRRRAGLDPAAHAPQPAAAAAAVADRRRRRPSARRAVWREPDQGIWEARGEPQHYVSSKLMCWVALDRAAEAGRDPRRRRTAARRGGATAEEIRADILEHGVDSRGVLRQHYETDALDASTLLAAIFGFLPADDERLRSDACSPSPTS